MKHLDLNNREKDATVFVVGAGPQLASLDVAVLEELSRRPTIGVNLTQYMFRPRYFVSAYIDHHILAHHRSPGSAQIHIRKTLALPVLDYLLPVQRRLFKPGDVLHRELSPAAPFLYTMRNVVLAATHWRSSWAPKISPMWALSRKTRPISMTTTNR